MVAVSLDYDELAAEVQRRQPAPFKPSPLFEEGIRLLLCEVLSRGLLTLEGRRLLQHEILRVMQQRVWFDSLRDGTTETFDGDVLVIAGLPRTTSTLLHNLLADLGYYVWVPYWRALEPFPLPPAPVVEAVERARAQTRFMAALAPDLLRVHPMRADRPEECITLLQVTGVSDRFAISLTAPDYWEWTQEPEVVDHAYREYAALLQLLFDGSRPIVLKPPSHSRHLEDLRRALPRAEVLWLTRPEDEVEASFARLVVASRQVFESRSKPDDWLGRWRGLDVPSSCRRLSWTSTIELVRLAAASLGVPSPEPEDHADWLRPSGPQLGA